MEIVNTKIKDLKILKPKFISDERGYFMESFKSNLFSDINFIQDNESMSSKGVLRGLHFQEPPYSQSKLVRVVSGEVLDVAVDLRKESDTYGMYESIVLSSENKLQFFIPKGFAHGFVVLSKTAIFSYKVDNPYSKLHEGGIIYNDFTLNIDWKIDKSKLIISEKDINLGSFKNFNSPF